MTPRIALPALLVVALILALGASRPAGGAGTAPQAEAPAPEFPHQRPEDWINSAPLSLEHLRGKVVMLDFWTFDCWNCYRSFPWLKSVERKFNGGGFTVIGVHTPEFEHERVRANVERKVKEFGLEHPVMMDNDYSYWRALMNRYWPAYYLVDKRGRLRARYVGETHVGDRRAREIEGRIAALLAEPAP